MGQFDVTGATGYGHAIIGNTAPLTDYVCKVTTLGSTSKQFGFTTDEMQFVNYVGSFGIGCFHDDSWGCVPAQHFTFEHIRTVACDLNLPTRWGTIYGPSIWWALKPGAAIDLSVFW